MGDIAITPGRVNCIFLVYPIDTAKEFYLLVYTEFDLLQPGNPQSSRDIDWKRSFWCHCAQKYVAVLYLVGGCL
jgi:hypothetical protein